MPSQDTMRPFCVFSQIRARSHTNTNINIPSFEWATKYLVGNSHERVFAGFVMIYSESASTVEYFTFVACVTRGIKVTSFSGVTKYVLLIEPLKQGWFCFTLLLLFSSLWRSGCI